MISGDSHAYKGSIDDNRLRAARSEYQKFFACRFFRSNKRNRQVDILSTNKQNHEPSENGKSVSKKLERFSSKKTVYLYWAPLESKNMGKQRTKKTRL